MALTLSNSHRSSTRAVFDATSEMLMELGRVNPQALVAVADFWKVVGDPASPPASIMSVFEGALAWTTPERLLELAVDLGNPHALLACGQFVDLSSLSADGTLLEEGSEEEEEAEFRTSAKGFPILDRDERGMIARLLLHRNDGEVDISRLAAVSGSPTVWCELLPMAGKRVTWLELALGTGHWGAAQRLWDEHGGRREFDEQARARLALAWMSGLGIRRRDWAKDLSREDQRQFFVWWDRLLSSEGVLTEPVDIKEGWSNVVLGSSGLNPAREILGLLEAALEQEGRNEPVDMGQILLATMNMGGALNRERFVLKPLDLLLQVVAHLGERDPLSAGVVQRLKDIDWPTIGMDEAACIPAVAALRHVGQCAPGWGAGTVYAALWKPLLQGQPESLQNSWFLKALARSVHHPEELDAAVSLFDDRFSFHENRSFIHLLAREFQEVDEKTGDGKPAKAKKKKALLENAINHVVPLLERTSTPEARLQWSAWGDSLRQAMGELKDKPELDDEAWRNIGLTISLPLPTASSPKPRF